MRTISQHLGENHWFITRCCVDRRKYATHLRTPRLCTRKRMSFGPPNISASERVFTMTSIEALSTPVDISCSHGMEAIPVGEQRKSISMRHTLSEVAYPAFGYG